MRLGAARSLAARGESNLSIAFVCEHGAAKSVIAAAYFNRLATQNNLPYRAVSRGTKPDDAVAPTVRTGLTAEGFDVSTARPKAVSDEDIARAGFSQPVSDISFATCGPRPVMLLAERGGIRNLGLSAENPFATPHEARALRYELDQSGAWRAVRRYDVGFYNRDNHGEPFINANCSGGIAFGFGYDNNSWSVDPSKRDQFVWITGDALCSPDGPCFLAGQGSRGGSASGSETRFFDSSSGDVAIS